MTRKSERSVNNAPIHAFVASTVRKLMIATASAISMRQTGAFVTTSG